MSDTPLQSYLDKWLTVHPEQRQALVFVDPQRYPGHWALAALEQEWIGAAYGVQEAGVAAVKLHWWAEELAEAARSGGRHPLVRAVFAEPAAQAIGSELWLAPIQAGLAQLERGSSVDYASQLAEHTPFHQALAALETAWWFGPEANPERAGRLATLHHLFHSLKSLSGANSRERLPLPMAALARHGLSRRNLATPSAARQQAVREQVQALAADLRQAQCMAGSLSVWRSLESWHVARQARAALRAADAVAALQTTPYRAAGALWHVWGAARRWRRMTPALPYGEA